MMIEDCVLEQFSASSRSWTQVDRSVGQRLTDRASGAPTHFTDRVGTTVELQWVEHLWDYENMFETGVVRANEC